MQQDKKHHSIFKSPTRAVVLSFALVILIGTVLLMLPASTKTRTFLSPMTALFTATSATCVTGLTLVDIYATFSFFGQGVLLALIQIGGLGLVTFSTFFIMLFSKRMGLNSARMASESIGGIGEFGDIKKTLRFVVLSCLVVEAVGALLLLPVFIPKYGNDGIFVSFFLSVSAFCNAGFDILGREGQFSSLSSIGDNYYALFVIMLLIILGGLGFVVWQDLVTFKKSRKLMLHTKIVLLATGVFIISGALLFLFFEWGNAETVGKMNFFQKLYQCLFHSVSCRTAGFNVIDTAALTDNSKLLSVFLMFIGAGPTGTAGGIKITTVIVVFMAVISTLRDEEEAVISHKTLSKGKVYRAMSVLFLSLAMVILSTILLSLIERGSGISFIDSLFEATSAFGTVGLSCGVTGQSGVLTQIILIITMFAGRVGPVSLGLSIAKSKKIKSRVLPEAKLYL